MKIFANILISISLLIIPVWSMADWDNGGVGDAEVLSITTLVNGSFYVHFDKDICDSDDNRIGYVYLNTSPNGIPWSADGTSMLLKTALSAKLAGLKVRVYADDSGTGWGCKMGALKIQ